MLSWSRPSPLRRRPSTPSPGDWPASSAMAWATCTSSEAPSWEAGLPKISRAIASSGGMDGVEVISILGSREVPVMATPIVEDWAEVVARKSSRGSIVSRLSSVTIPFEKVSRRLPRLNVPRRMVKPPMTAGAAGVPLTVSWPLISASRPRPRTKTACGARTSSASLIGVASGGGGGFRDARRAGVGWLAAIAAPGLLISRTSMVGKDAVSPPPTEISARSIVTGPEISMPEEVAPVILSVLLTVATRSGRLTSSARWVARPTSSTRPRSASKRIEPLPVTVPVPAWNVRRWI